MAWVTPTDVATGDVLTASKWNQEVVANSIALPRGVLGRVQSDANFGTSATHTTYQDDGLSISVTYEGGRVLRCTVGWTIYPSGGLQSIVGRFVRGSTNIFSWSHDGAGLNVGGGTFYTVSWVFNGPATGATETFKTQIAAASANTQVNTFGSKFLLVEDLGAQ